MEKYRQKLNLAIQYDLLISYCTVLQYSELLSFTYMPSYSYSIVNVLLNWFVPLWHLKNNTIVCKLRLGLRELCSKSSSLFYSEFPQKLYHYAHYYSQNLLIILIILNFTAIFLQLFFTLLYKLYL